jgi:regulator of protease activity HflC (stomatin/prohibitin superfamily)
MIDRKDKSDAAAEARHDQAVEDAEAKARADKLKAEADAEAEAERPGLVVGVPMYSTKVAAIRVGGKLYEARGGKFTIDRGHVYAAKDHGLTFTETVE